MRTKPFSSVPVTGRLYELSPEALKSGSWLHNEMKARGENRSPRVLINRWCCWRMTVETFLRECEYDDQGNKRSSGIATGQGSL